VSVIWHDVECGAYEADLPVWHELAEGSGGPILDLGCGTGRVALHLARRDHRVLGLDLEPAFVAELNRRAGSLPAEARVGDARDFELGTEFGLALAPMQLIQLFTDASSRIACLSCAGAHLRPGGVIGCAIVERMVGGANPAPDEATTDGVIPDAREIDGWVYSSLPLEARVGTEEIVVRRLRQTVSPTGELDEEDDEIRLCVVSAEDLEREGATAGLRPLERRAIPPTEEHVGSTLVLLQRET
jgi:SAM-dependent methyltransferase